MKSYNAVKSSGRPLQSSMKEPGGAQLPDHRSVCLAIPVRNEAENLPSLISFIQRSAYPGIQSIRVALAPSSDASDDILNHWAEQDARVKILENVEETAACGLNLCLYDAPVAGFFVRLDAHARYEEGYIEKLVAAAEQSGALNTGGVQQFRIENSIQLATAVILTLVSRLGLNRWRNPSFSGFTDTVYLGCYRMDVLRNIGGFSEEQKTNQDAELNQRLNNIRKNAVYQDGSIVSWYAPRKTLRDIALQYFAYGEGRAVNWITHWPVIPLRSILAPIFLLFSLIVTVTSPVLAGLALLFISLCGYLLALRWKLRFAIQRNDLRLEPALIELPAVLAVMVTCFSAGFVRRFLSFFPEKYR